MTHDHYAKLKSNRDRHDVITGQIREAQKTLDLVRGEPKGSEFEVRRDKTTPMVGILSREVLAAALRQYVAGKEEVLTEIDLEFDKL